MTKFSISRAPAWFLAVLVFAAAFAVALAAKAAGLNRSPAGAGVLTAVTFAAAAPVMILYWRRLDEAAQEAHKFAWYWGGSAGMVALIVAFSVLMAPDSNIVTADFLGADQPKDLLAMGMLAAFLSQVAGYTVAWAGWWIARR